MTVSATVSVLAAVGQIALALLTLARGGPLKWPLALLCLDVAGWTAASSAYETYQVPALALIDHALSPLSAALVHDFVLAFVGARRTRVMRRVAAFVACGTLSAATIAMFVAGRGDFLWSHAWSTWLLASALPTTGFALFDLVRHVRTTRDRGERARTWLLVAVFAIGTAFGATEGLDVLTPSVPPLGALGMLVCAVTMAVVALRFDLFGRAVSPGVVGFAAGAAAIALIAWVAAIRVGGAVAGAVALVTMTCAVAAVAVVRDRLTAAAAAADRTARLITIGRFAAQMDHDVRNPLAAVKASAQMLVHDLRDPQPDFDRLDFACLLLDQVERIEAIFDRYRRMARVEPMRRDTDVSAVVASVLDRQAPAVPPHVAIHRELVDEAPMAPADPDLLATVVENLTRNAIDAITAPGAVTVRTSLAGAAADEVVLEVEDTGSGMDARTRERACDDFFTTKASGSGMGLAFVRRVVEAHGGRFTLESRLGEGTKVRCTFPVRRPPASHA